MEGQLGLVDPTATDMFLLSTLKADNRGITDLTGLEYARFLRSLDLSGNHISDISAVSGLTNLNLLHLADNEINDISGCRTVEPGDSGTGQQ